MHDYAQNLLWPLGRLLLGGVFIIGGLRHFFNFDGVAQAIAGRGIPFPRLVLFLGSVFQMLAGACLASGIFVAYAALGLVVFTLAASFMLLNFWSLEEGPAREAAVNAWHSNIAVIGGLLIATTHL